MNRSFIFLCANFSTNYHELNYFFQFFIFSLSTDVFITFILNLNENVMLLSCLYFYIILTCDQEFSIPSKCRFRVDKWKNTITLLKNTQSVYFCVKYHKQVCSYQFGTSQILHQDQEDENFYTEASTSLVSLLLIWCNMVNYRMCRSFFIYVVLEQSYFHSRQNTRMWGDRSQFRHGKRRLLHTNCTL